MTNPETIRPLDMNGNDDQALASIIRKAIEEFDVPREGTVYTDPTTDSLHQLFRTYKSAYYIAEEGDLLLGGCGFFPTPGLPEGYAELVKLYLSPEARGRGLAFKLVQHCFENARRSGYTALYLESFPEMIQAVRLYESLGFKRIKKALGNSGHYACTVWMEKPLTEP